jgi:hypothetical protein
MRSVIIVVSPLVALMADQTLYLEGLGLSVANLSDSSADVVRGNIFCLYCFSVLCDFLSLFLMGFVKEWHGKLYNYTFFSLYNLQSMAEVVHV